MDGWMDGWMDEFMEGRLVEWKEWIHDLLINGKLDNESIH
jgi:hypothetical protein